MKALDLDSLEREVVILRSYLSFRECVLQNAKRKTQNKQDTYRISFKKKKVKKFQIYKE